MTFSVTLFKTDCDPSDIEAVSRVLRRGTFWAVGPEIEKFEEEIAAQVGTRFAVAFNSGTSALHAVLAAYKVKEVIVPTFTFIASANAVVLAGGKPIFAESESSTFGLDCDDVESRIGPDTSAIMVMHYGGCPARDSIKLRNLARKRNLLLIEDAAQSLGASVEGIQLGNLGDAAIFSFCQNKLISTGEGGVAVTNDRTIFEKLKLIRSHGRFETVSGDYFTSIHDSDYVAVGYNYRMPTMCAALGSSQLRRLSNLIERRVLLARQFKSFLEGLEGVSFQVPPQNVLATYQMFTLLLQDQELRDRIQSCLKQQGIMSKVYFEPVHLKTFYSQCYGYEAGYLPSTEALSRRVLTLPFFPSISLREMEFIAEVIGDVVYGEKQLRKSA